MERIGDEKKRRVFSPTLFCIGLLLLCAAALCIRAPYGFDWTDEPYYTALPYRFILGDRPFVDAWEVHQLSGLMALPFLRLYLVCAGGSTQGAILYFRYVLILFQLGIAVYAFFVVRKRSGNPAGLLFAGLLLFYAHYGVNGFSYNMLAPLFTVLSALLLFDAMEGKGGNKGKTALCGACYALAVAAQPYFIISLPVWVVFWLILGLSNNSDVAGAREKLTGTGEKRTVNRPFLYFLLGGGAVACLFLVYVLSKASLSEILMGIKGMLGDPDHEKTNVLPTLGSYINGVRVLFGPCSYLAAGLCGYGAALYFVKDSSRRALLGRIGVSACAALAAGTAVWVLLYDYPDYHKINLSAMNLALLGPALYFSMGKKPDRSLLLYFLGAALSLAVQLGSNTRIRAASGALLPASLAALLYFMDRGGALFCGKAALRFRRLAALACACSVALTAGLRLTTVYRDEPLPCLNTAIASGPAAGLITTGERAAQYALLYRDITENAPGEGRILITNLMPAGYLMTRLPPASPSVFNMTLDADWLALYERALPENRPTYVFAVSEGIGTSNDIALSGAARLNGRDGWKKRELPAGTAYLLGED